VYYLQACRDRTAISPVKEMGTPYKEIADELADKGIFNGRLTL